jgi:cholesterol transport system auxiliary component
MNMLRISRFFSAILLAALSAGCSVLGGEQRDPVTIYAPQIDVATDPSWPTVRWQLSVSRPTAARVIDSPRIAVRPAPNELQVYRGASWSQPPADLVETTVLRALEDSGKILSVARSGVGIRADYKLVMDLRRFEADYAGAAAPSAVIELNAKLLHAAEQRVVASRTFVQSQPAAGTELPQVTTAFDQALERLTSEVVGWTLVSGQADAQAKR